MADQTDADFHGYDILGVLKYTSEEQEVRNFFDKWADNWDKDADSIGYTAGILTSKRFLDLAKEHHLPTSTRIIDIGAGTGLVAKILKEQGFLNIDGLDISVKMLKLAEEQDLYRNYICNGFGMGPLPVEPETYDVATAAGCFSRGHIGPAGLDQLTQVVKKGGFMIWTIRTEVYDDDKGDFGIKVNELCERKVWTVVERKKIVQHANVEENNPLRYGYLVVCQKL